MARKPRLDVPGAFYHVIARGNRRAAIFHDDADYRAYLDRLLSLGSGMSIDLLPHES